MNPAVSDETLNAFVDGELDVAESEALIARMREDKALAQRVCALRSLQTMVRLAYTEPPAAAGRKTGALPSRKFVQRCAFGCLVLLAGLATGWALRGAGGALIATGPVVPGANFHAVSLKQQADPDRILLHLDSGAPGKMEALLDQAEGLLDAARQRGRTMQLEVIVNSQGIDLLRADHNPYAARIAQMKARHPNLQWVACGQSVARFRSEGQDVKLLRAAQTTPTAIGEIVTRLQQGWTYIRV